MKLKDILRNRLVIVGIFIGLAMVNLVVTTVAFVKGDVITGLAFGLFTLNLLCGAFKYIKWEEDIRKTAPAPRRGLRFRQQSIQ